MKLRMAHKLALLLAGIGLAAALAMAVLAERVSRTLLVEGAQEALLTSTQVLARRVAVMHANVARDLRIVAEHPLTGRALKNSEADAADRLAQWFDVSMRSQPAYFQMRLISAADYGLERVRIDRHQGQLLRIDGDALQEKAHFPYVSEALALPAQEMFSSEIAINHEDGAHDGLEQPTAIFSMPVYAPNAPNGKALGVVVINVDLRNTFALLAQDLPKPYQLFLANGEGDILLHPNATLTFGFDRGERHLIQTSMPALAAVVDGSTDHAVLDFNLDTSKPMVAAFTRIEGAPHAAPPSRTLILGLAQPASEVLARAEQLRRALLGLAVPVAMGSLVFAFLLARTFTRPLAQLERAAHGFGQGDMATDLPVDRHDEIGTLARSFAHMQYRVGDQLQTLRENQQTLEHLSQHDSLTGLPNRRFFMQLLEQALVRAQRHGLTVDLMFIDLDGFKPVNDQFGHECGDQVLQTVVHQLRAGLRQADILARLGGDEFVVLLDGTPDQDTCETLATKVIELISAPIAIWQGHTTVRVGASIGLARYPQDGRTASELLQSADRAMYAAKEAGKGCWRFATSGSQGAS